MTIMNWKQLISNKRLGQEERHIERHDDRSEFKRDYDRLIFSAPFRRMQNKTQVFPLPGSIFVHNRLTHSLEVASVGMSLGNDVAAALTKKHPELAHTLFPEIGTIVSAACLAHDMGNPPFGHSGEKAIQTFFTEGRGAELKGMVGEALWNDDDLFHARLDSEISVRVDPCRQSRQVRVLLQREGYLPEDCRRPRHNPQVETRRTACLCSPSAGVSR